MGQSVKISVILPNYNGERHIARAINSFLSQTHQNKELIIVDGKSSDSSHTIIQKVAAQNQNITWRREIDLNVTDAINIGLRFCTGDFIAFLASDVFYYSDDVFSSVNDHFNLVPFDCVYFDYYSYNSIRKTISLVKCPNISFNKKNLLKHGNIVGFDNIFISKNVYERHQYNPKYNLCSDWEFFLRITQDNLLFLYVEKIATINVQDGNNLTQKYRSEQMNQVREVGLLYNSDNVKLYFDKYLRRTFKQRTMQLVKRIFSHLLKRGV